MDQLLHKVKKELKEIGEKELTTANVEIAGKLVDIVKDIGEIKEQEMQEGYGMRYQERGSYNDGRGNYMRGNYGRSNQSSGRGYMGYNEGGYGMEYRNQYNNQGGEYGHGNWGLWGTAEYDKLAECLDRIADGKDMYGYDKSRYRGDDERVLEGLEKMMYGVCMFVETAMNFAETPEEKEVIRKHIRKLESI